MTRSPRLSALTRRRFATPRSAALVIIALTAFAAFVIAAAPRALVGVVRAEVAHQIENVPPTSRDLTATLSTGVPQFGPARDPEVTDGWDDGAPALLGELGQALADNRASFDDALQPLVSTGEFAEYAQPMRVVPHVLPASAPNSDVQLLTEPTATQQTDVVEGGWPRTWDGTGAVEVAMTAEAAAAMEWPLGEERGIQDPAPDAPTGAWAEGMPTYRLVGLLEATEPEADRWLHLPTALTATVFDDGNRRPTATSVAWVETASWAQLQPYLDRPGLIAWYPVDSEAALEQDPVELLAALRGATTTSVPFDETGQVRARFSTDIVAVLATALARAASASAILVVAAVGPLAVSVALVVLAGALIIRRRRTDLSLMSARGARIGRLRGLLFWEGILLGVPAAVVATIAGVLLTSNDAGTLPTAIALLAGIAPALALALTLRPSLLEHGRSDLDVPVRSRTARIMGWVLILLAVMAVVLLVVRGIGPATVGIDPLVVAAPLLATVALALIVVRLHPIPIAAALRAARRGRGVVGLVGAARNLRDPAAGTTAVLAMLVAVAIAVFSSLVLATVDRGATVAAQRAVGADIQLSGPYFDPDTIGRMRTVDDVEDAVGVLRGDYLNLVGPDGQASVLVIASEIERLTAIQAGMVGAVPEGTLTPGAEPTQIIESTAIAADVGAGDTTFADRPVDVVAVVDRVLGLTISEQFVLLDQSDYDEITGLGFFPRTVLVDIAGGADAAEVAAELSSLVPGNHSVQLLEDSTAEIRDSPAVSALRTVLFAALAAAVALSVVALLLVAGVSRDARSRVIALMRSMGLDRRRARGIVAWEFVPLGVTALAGGVLLGVVLPLLVVTSIDLRPFTGGGAQPALTIDPVLSGTLIAAVVVALALAVVLGVVSARTTSMATVLRTEED